MTSQRVFLRKWCLYTHSDAAGKVFYVGAGVATRPFECTRRNKTWAEMVSTMDFFDVRVVEWFDDRVKALLAETQLIKALLPCCNLMKNGYTNPGRRKKASAVHLGKVLSDETKAKISAAKKGRPGNWLGRRHTEETKAKLRAASKPYPIVCQQTSTVYASVSEAALAMGLSKISLRGHMRGAVKHVQGYTFTRQ